MATDEDRHELAKIIEYMNETTEESWCKDVVRDKNGGNCFFGHLSAMVGTDKAYSPAWDWFEETWGTTYYVYPINYGFNPNYPQSTPKQRIVAYLENLLSGEEMNMEQYWDHIGKELDSLRSVD